MKRVLPSLVMVLVLTAALPGPAQAQMGSVMLKINVANPSQKEPQTIPVKVYLPKEATPKDVKDPGGLALDYDPDAGMYYVHGEVTLEAGQSVTKVVQMEDIWVFGEDQLVAFVSQAKKLAGKLTEPSAVAAAAGIVKRIEGKVQDIVTRQKETDGKPAERIHAYRQGLTVITTIEEDLAALDKLGQDLPARDAQAASPERDARIPLLAGAAAVDAPEAGAPLGRSISMTTAWRLIFAILAFLGVLSAVFFLTWHRLLRVTVGGEQQAIPLVLGDPGG